MTEKLKYTVFRVRWGYFGLLGTEKGLLRSCLPIAGRQVVEKELLSGIGQAACDSRAFKVLQEKITAYFNGSYVDFADESVVLAGLSEFARSVLSTCQAIPYGQQVSYADLAKLVRRPKAGRAVGGVMGNNHVPLIVPCHRVIRNDGTLGGFSAVGGIGLKKRMLKLESGVKK